MIIRSASFETSSPSIKQSPAAGKPEFGFIGRSNVGKSSLINMLTGRPGLARISANPGKTRTINHFLINETWYLVDLPGYGYAKVPVKMSISWNKSIEEYILKRETLVCLFMLIDSRLRPQRSDLTFMEFLGNNRIPFARVFTKVDKISGDSLRKAIQLYDEEMLKAWESLPATFFTSTLKRSGRDEILGFIEDSINNFSNPH